MLTATAAGGASVGVLADSLLAAAVSMKYREGLRQGRMVLVSPYDPSAGFNVGNAMSRNKYIYALADRALIINSSYEKGGTWAGAKEELKRKNQIPVWVRLEGEVAQGNHQLLKLGAMPFPPAPWNNLLSLLEEAEKLHQLEAQKNAPKQLSLSDANPVDTQSETVDRQDTKPAFKLPESAYEAILPLLLHHLREPKREKEVAELLDVGVGQARLWLKRAIQDKYVEKKKANYSLNCNNKQLDLWKFITIRNS